MEDNRYYALYHNQRILVETNHGYPYRPNNPKHFVDIGRSDDKTKVILLDEWYPDNSYFILNNHEYNDLFDIKIIKNSILSVTRTDVNSGWEHNHCGHIIHT